MGMNLKDLVNVKPGGAVRVNSISIIDRILSDSGSAFTGADLATLVFHPDPVDALNELHDAVHYHQGPNHDRND